jgi:hypothetical protein
MLHAFLTTALDGGGWSASCSSHFTPGGRAPGAHWIGGWEGPRVGLDTVSKRRINYTYIISSRINIFSIAFKGLTN